MRILYGKRVVKLGDKFTKRKFLLIPKYIDGNFVWLETVLQTKEWSNDFFDTHIIDLIIFGGSWKYSYETISKREEE